jgi:hypothetical protein
MPRFCELRTFPSARREVILQGMWILDRLRRRRSTTPAWDSLTHEERGIIARNSQPGAHGAHESTKALGSAARNNENRSGW